MAVQTYQVIYNCTPTQLETVLIAIAAVPATVIRAPQRYQGLIQLASTEQIDWSYDGQYFLRFYGANPAPISAQTQTGIPATELTATMSAFLTTNVNPTCGAPVPSNQANVPGPAGSATGPI